jgi:TonB family protein
MNAFINYLIEVNLGLVFFYAIYWLLLRSENQFGFKRIYLLGSLLASLLFPFVSIKSGVTLIPSLSNSIPSHWLPEVIIYADGAAAVEETTTAINYWAWLTNGYLFVTIVFLSLFIFQISTLVRLFIRAKHYAWKNYTVAESERIKGVFSFFTFIFLSPAERLEEQEKQEILRHEEVHIQKLHSFDILLVNIIGIMCWFNPVIQSYKRSLVQVHEFEADARSVEGMDVDWYCGLLAKVALQQNGYVLANHFNNSFTIKRINMMKTVRKKISQWKMASALLLLGSYFVVVACQDQVISDIKEMGQNSSIALNYPEEVQLKLNELKGTNPNDEFIVIEMNEEGKKKFEALDADKSFISGIKEMSVVKSIEPESSFIIIVKGEKVDALADFTKDSNEVFTIVEETAEPINGIEEFYKYVGANLKYPEEARQKGIEGRVFIEFIVNKDGSISNAHTIRGLSSGCDEEALRVIANAAPWKPGKQSGKAVKQRMVIPIIFKFGNSDFKNDFGQNESKTMDEMVVVGQPKKN